MVSDRLRWWEDIPLGLALVAQSYVVGLWYYASINGASAWVDLAVAIGAGLALDLIVVTTVMGRRQGRSSGWSWATSFGAFLCSSLIALDRYGWEARSLLHVAFPLVVFLYSQHLATPQKVVTEERLPESISPEIPVQVMSEPITEAEEGAQITEEEPSAERLPIPGYVYFLHSEENGTKIGCTTDLAGRIQDIARFVPFDVRLVHSIPSDDMYALEHRIHRYYEIAGKRINGEWFRLDAYDLRAIKRIDKKAALDIFPGASTRLAPIALSGVPLLDNVDSSLILADVMKGYTCEHCGSILASKQAKGNAARFGCSNPECPGRASRKKVA
jgi:Meiotically Up-regulated Gene 113 (MUG113) protein